MDSRYQLGLRSLLDIRLAVFVAEHEEFFLGYKNELDRVFWLVLIAVWSMNAFNRRGNRGCFAVGRAKQLGKVFRLLVRQNQHKALVA